ncbi:ATP-dependent DNA helicase [Trichonephila clavipes]|nr:ATP-dependent DNA helicase [Trichonephila clavipes]
MPSKSIDTTVDEKESVVFLYSLDILGMPPYNLLWKISSLVILLRNLSTPRLCNGTRLVFKRITGNLLKATILIVKFKGEKKIVLLPRIPLIPSESAIPFKRLHFSGP